ncbi:MAG: hypothetical protein U5L96_16905 [Owenweeksia sp.]|nr:hypothetical protein [Owenweeksia sp.]
MADDLLLLRLPNQNYQNHEKVSFCSTSNTLNGGLQSRGGRGNLRLKAENEELMMENEQKDSIINESFTAFARIQENLASIREKEERIENLKTGDVETSKDVKEEILSDIEVINELLTENRQALANMRDKLKRYQYENSKFKRMVDDLGRQVEAKDSQVVVLKENLASLNFEMEALNSKFEQSEETRKKQKERIEKQIEELNAAYYAVGSYDDLEENKVVDKTGGFIGLGKTKTLADDFNRDYFTKIDVTQTKVIPLDLEDDKVKLITNHPSESYNWIKEEDQIKSLEITDQEKFWSSSKYLVVLVD